MSRAIWPIELIALIVLLLASCGADPETTSGYSPGQMIEAILSAQDQIPALHPLYPEDAYYTEYLMEYYRIESDALKDGAIYYADGMLADEVAVFLVADHTDAGDVKDALTDYKDWRTDVFTGYAPRQAAILEDGIVAAYGDYVALLVCADPQKAESVFQACLGDDPPAINPDIKLITTGEDSPAEISGERSKAPEPSAKYDAGAFDPDTVSDPDIAEPKSETVDPNTALSEAVTPDTAGDAVPETGATGKPQAAEPTVSANQDEDPFDPEAILAAWHSGDQTLLSEKNRSILDACSDVIAEVTHDGMSDVEKELAVHDWIVNWAAYDMEFYNNSPDAKPAPDHDNPYGTIFHKKAICSGYTTTFQLFMDMLGIRCITVNGTVARRDGDHAWNMVYIDDVWYCVDVTWDDPVGGIPLFADHHKYFNVSSQYMRDTNHIWDESVTPEAE